MIQYDGLKM